ncbi:hypothetical protein BGZ65_007200, partial [Modicella reniformis]
MEVNKDEANRCLDIACRHLSSGNYASARKFGNKSIALYPTPEAIAFLARLDQEEASSSSQTAEASSSQLPTDSTKSSPTAGTASSSARPTSVPPRSRSTPTDHKPVEREYTPEHVAAVKKIRSSGGDFYKVLGLTKDATDADIKKAYRKLALQMHPDKNSAPGADEAFKIVSKAFTVLSDPQKRAIFDQHGPEDGKSTGVNYDRASPMAFHSATFAGPGFGGTHQFRPRTQTQRRQQRQHPQQQAGGGDGGTSGLSGLIQILPLILLFIMTMTSSFFSDSDSSNLPAAASDFSLGKHGSYKTARFTSARHVPYFVNEQQFMSVFMEPGQNQLSPNKVVNGYKVGQILTKLEENVEREYLGFMRNSCLSEKRQKEMLYKQALGAFGGLFGVDKSKLDAAQRMETPSCDTIRKKYGHQY